MARETKSENPRKTPLTDGRLHSRYSLAAAAAVTEKPSGAAAVRCGGWLGASRNAPPVK